MIRTALLTLALLFTGTSVAEAAFTMYPNGKHNFTCPLSQADHTQITAQSGAQFSSVKWSSAGLFEYWTSPLGGYLKFDGAQYWNNTSDFLNVSPQCY